MRPAVEGGRLDYSPKGNPEKLRGFLFEINHLVLLEECDGVPSGPHRLVGDL